ncbi:hypothetical protein FQU85_05405 [Salarchaeum sp. JOR-1]|nr:hypothetical protein FQU85_05405 [Salarchaeum sp. JOR-1]
MEGTLTVSPFWAYLNGDLHAHVVAAPFLVLVAALAYTVFRARGRARLVRLALLGVAGGFLTLVNTWGLPTTIGLAALALAFSPHTPSPRQFASSVANELARYASAVAGALTVAALAVLVAAPFLLFHTPVTHGVGFLPPRTALGPLLLAYGVFLAAFALAVRRYDLSAPRPRVAFALGLLAAALAGVLLALDLAAVVVVGPLLAAGWYVLRRRTPAFWLVLLVAGAGLVLAVEFAYARVYPFDPAVPRWNTVYKVSMQVWVLWGIGAAVAAAGVLERAAARVRSAAPPLRTARALAPAVVVAVLLLGAAVFPAAALVQHHTLAGDQPSLDGTRYVETYHPYEAAAVDWLDSHVDGTPTLLSKPGRTTYTWVNAPSSLTGIPTVVGWTHEKGYRGVDAYTTRATDAAYMLDADWDAAALLLDYYDVQYVYYGPNEREAYGPSIYDNRTGVTVAYQNEEVTIYEIDADEACTAVRDSCPPVSPSS